MNYQLPVSADVVDESTFLSWGLPHQVPNVPLVQVSPNIEPLMPLLTGYLRLELQNNVGKGPGRVFLYNYLSRNQFQNDEFLETLVSLAGLVEYTLFTQPQYRQNPEEAIAFCARDICTMMASIYAREFPGVWQKLSGQAREAADVWITKYNSAKNQIQGFLMNQGYPQNQMPPQGYPQQYPQQGYPQQPQQPMQYPNQQYPPQNVPQQQGGWQGPQGYPPQQNMQYPNQGYPQQNMGYPQQPQQPMHGGPQSWEQWQQNPHPMQGGPMQSGYGGPMPPRPHPNQGMGMGGPRMGGDMFQMNHGPQQAPLPTQRQFKTTLKPRSQQPQQPQQENTRANYDMESFGPEGYQDHRTPQQKAHDANQPKWYDEGQTAEQINRPAPQSHPARSRFQQTMQGEPQPAPQPPAPTQAPEDEIVVTNPERPYDQFFAKGLEFRPAFMSGWKKTFTMEQPYRVAYNPQKEMLFHARTEDGTVREVLQPMEPDMDYLQHELNEKLKKSKSSLDDEHSPKIVPNWEIVERMGPEEDDDTSEEEREVDIKSGKQPLVLPDVLHAHSFEQAKVLHEVRLIERGVTDKHMDTPKEYYYQHLTPMKLHGPDLKETRELVFGLANAENVVGLITQLQDLHGSLDNDLWHTIEERLTDHVNTILAQNFQLDDWTIDSIVDDWDELHEAMCGEFGKEEGDALFKTLEVVGHKDIVKGTCSVLLDEALDTYVAELPIKDKDAREKFKASLVVLAEAVSVTHVPWNISESTLVVDDEGAVILESKFPELHKAVEGIFERTDEISMTFRHRYIETRDGSLYELHRGYLNKDFYLLHQLR